MNENWINSPSVYTDIKPVVNHLPSTHKAEGKIVLEYNKGPEYDTEIPVDDTDPEITKLDYVNPEYLDPVNMYMNWNKKHPEGQWAPMKSENKMLSYEQKNKNKK